VSTARINSIANEYVTAVKAHEGSDIDICIISPIFGKNKYCEMIRHTRLEIIVKNGF